MRKRHNFIRLSLLLLVQTISLNAQSPLNLSLISEVPAPFLTVPQTIVVDALDRPFYYLAAKTGGLQVFDIQNINTPILIKTIPQSQLSNLEVSDVYQRGNQLFLALGNFFGNNPQVPGMAIVDVTDPENPSIVSTWVSTTATKGSGFVTVDGDYAYLGAMADGFFILDIQQPDSIKEVSHTIPDQDFPIMDPEGAEQPRGRGMAIRGDLLYLCYDAGGLRIMNISDKQHPEQVGQYLNPGNAGKQQAFNNILLRGNLAYIAEDYCGLEIVDISNPAAVQQVGWWNPWGCELPSNLWLGSPGHTNQLAIDTSQELVFLSSGQSELTIVDVSIPGQAQLKASYGAVDDNKSAWGLSLVGNRVYLTYILSFVPFSGNWAGVKILEWSSTSKVSEAPASAIQALQPNPFYESFSVGVSLPTASLLQLDILDLTGRPVGHVAAGIFPFGTHQFDWNGSLAPGIYFLRVRTNQGVSLKKLIKARD